MTIVERGALTVRSKSDENSFFQSSNTECTGQSLRHQNANSKNTHSVAVARLGKEGVR